MALWNGSAINTNETAMVFNQLANMKAIAMVRNKHGFLYAVLGKQETGSTPGAGTGFQRLKKISGKKIEVKLLGKLASPGTVADGSAEVATETLTHTTDYWGAAEFDLAHYVYKHPVPHSELMRFMGDEAKTASYLDEVFQLVMLSYEKVWATALSTAAAPSRTVLGGWNFAVDDDNTYGTIDRTDSTNADFQGVVKASTGDLTLPKIHTEMDNVRVNGGRVSLGVAGATVYGKIRQLIQPYTQVTYDKDWTEFGGEHIRYAGVSFTLDPDCPTQTLGLLEPESWLLYMDKDTAFTSSGLVHDISRVSTHVLPTEFWMQLICKSPNHNARMEGITS